MRVDSQRHPYRTESSAFSANAAKRSDHLVARRPAMPFGDAIGDERRELRLVRDEAVLVVELELARARGVRPRPRASS